MPPISAQIRLFSPLAQEVFLKNLGLEDKNRNGVIDRGAGEGYEQFIEKYGDADIGFAANGVTYGAANGQLEEPEIINHYYLSIRFKEPVETEIIENEMSAYIYANNIPLVWLDDEEGTVMNAVNRVLGEGWNEQEVTENEAVRMFHRAMEGMRIRGRTGDPARTGYYTLPEFVTQKAGYCFEVAQFGFWFFSELGINSVTEEASLTRTLSHAIIRLIDSDKALDYSGTSNRYRVSRHIWQIRNPIKAIGLFYETSGEALEQPLMFAEALSYDKHDLDNIGGLMQYYFNSPIQDYAETISLGEFFISLNQIPQLLNTTQANSSTIKEQVKTILLMLLISYHQTNDINGYNNTMELLNKHYRNDKIVKEYIRDYRL
jgi:hypothetical protein